MRSRPQYTSSIVTPGRLYLQAFQNPHPYPPLLFQSFGPHGPSNSVRAPISFPKREHKTPLEAENFTGKEWQGFRLTGWIILPDESVQIYTVRDHPSFPFRRKAQHTLDKYLAMFLLQLKKDFQLNADWVSKSPSAFCM